MIRSEKVDFFFVCPNFIATFAKILNKHTQNGDRY